MMMEMGNRMKKRREKMMMMMKMMMRTLLLWPSAESLPPILFPRSRWMAVHRANSVCTDCGGNVLYLPNLREDGMYSLLLTI
jgi:hypothetical protein